MEEMISKTCTTIRLPVCFPFDPYRIPGPSISECKSQPLDIDAHTIRQYLDYVFRHARCLQPWRQIAQDTSERIIFALRLFRIPFRKLIQIAGMPTIISQWLLQDPGTPERGSLGCKKFIGFDEQRFRQWNHANKNRSACSQAAGAEKRAKFQKLMSFLQAAQAARIATVGNIDVEPLALFIHLVKAVTDTPISC